jgi:uncharacterized protein DUF1488
MGGERVMRLDLFGDSWMPLTRGKIVGYDSERLAFTFEMMNGDEAVECRISDAAMDQLIGAKGTESLARQALFLTHRDRIEQIASDLYDAKPPVKGAVIRIFTKNV